MSNVTKNTRKLYNRCYQAWREQRTFEVLGIYAANPEIYRTAGDTYVAEAGTFSGWKNHTRHMRFIQRKLEVWGW